jgi:hypothetical protein
MGQMVGDQTANQAAKPLKNEEKKITSSGTVGLQLSCFYFFSIQSSLCMSLRQAWSPLVAAQAGAWWSGDLGSQ